MKKQIIFAISALTLSATTANAEFYGKALYIMGQSTIQNANGIEANGYGVELGYQIPAQWFSIGVEKKQISHKTANDHIGTYGPPPTDVYLKDYNLDFLSLNARFFLTSFETWRPYFGGSFGKVNISEDVDINGSIGSKSSSVNHFSYMVGFETRLSGKLFIDTSITRRSASSESPIGSQEADGFRGIDFELGIKYLF